MSRNSHQFDHDAYLQALAGYEEILEEYLNSIPAAGVTVQRPVTSSAAFSAHLGTCPPEEYRVLTSGLVESWEMASDEGHEQMLAALRHVDGITPSILAMPSECLALYILSSRRDLFETALSLDEIRRCDALHMFKPRRSVSLVADLNAATNAFRGEIAARCGEKFGSRRILMRRFEDAEIFTIGFYFEKAPKAQRRLTGSEVDPNLEREEARLLQFDIAIFEPSTGMLSVRSGYGRLTDPIRQAFATAFLGDPDAYEWVGASQILDLNAFFEPDLDMLDADGVRPMLTEVDYSPANDEMMARYRITGCDVLEILARDERGDQVRRSTVKRVTLKMAMEGVARRRKVVLTYPNKVEFKRGAEASRIIERMHEWDVLQLPEATQVPA